jgi:hypothetical protein
VKNKVFSIVQFTLYNNKGRVTGIVFMLITFAAVFYSFKSADDRSEKLAINLKWNKAYEGEDWDNMRTGILWSLSFLGAALPEGSLNKAIEFKQDTFHFTLHVDRLGFNKAAEDALILIIDSLKQSEEYTKTGSIDVARFFVLTLHSTYHYYAITGAEQTLQQFKDNHPFASPKKFLLLNSGVAKHNRKITFHKPSDALQLAFIAEESDDSVTSPHFHPYAFEVSALMPNGQMRYAVYNEDGTLAGASPAKFGVAGKPGKCLWCHEIVIQRLYYVTDEVEGEMNSCEFEEHVQDCQDLLEAYRATLKTDVKYQNRQDHTQAELLYISFMEPSAERLANEWQMKKEEVLVLLKNRPTHPHEEFKFLGDLYNRTYIDSIAPFNSLRVPQSVREPSEYEPNLFR